MLDSEDIFPIILAFALAALMFAGLIYMLSKSFNAPRAPVKIDSKMELKEQKWRMEDIRRRQEDLMRSQRDKIRDMRR